METYALSLFKSAAWLTGFLFVYLLFLKNDRFFEMKRYYLIAGILASLLFPLISFHYIVEITAPLTSPAGQASAVQEGSLSSGAAFPAEGIDYKLLAAGFYLTVVLILTARLIIQLFSFRSMIRRGEKSCRGRARVVKVPGMKSSFSFFRYIFIGASVEESEAAHILNHEEVHVRQRHWFDLLLAEIIKTIQWINPFAWIYAEQIRQNHEFLADEAALKKVSDPGSYRAVLLNHIFNAQVLPLSNSFSYSKNKKRFAMMDKIIFSPYRKLKLLVIIPVAAIIFFAFATPEYQYVAPADNSAITDIATTLQKTVNGIVMNEDGKPMAGVTIKISGQEFSIITGEAGKFTFSGLPVNTNIVFTYPGYWTVSMAPDFSKEMVIKMTKDTEAKPTEFNVVPAPVTQPGETAEVQPLWIVDGVIREKHEYIDPNNINTISILKDESATAVFGEKGKNGVVIVTLKKPSGTVQSGEVRGIVVSADGKALEGANVVISGTTQGTTTDKNGVFRLANVPAGGMLVASYIGYRTKPPIPVSPDEMTITLHRDTVNLGSIAVPPPPPPPPAASGEKPLYVVDGKIVDEISTIDASDIETINVLKGTSAVNKYGVKGKDGVVEIKTKPERVSPAAENAKPDVMVMVEEMPMFPGGEKALQKWIYGNIKAVAGVDRGSIREPVNVVFTVGKTGKISDVRIKRSVHPLLDAEALRVVENMPDWSPGKQNGKPVDVYYQLPIDFNPVYIRGR